MAKKGTTTTEEVVEETTDLSTIESDVVQYVKIYDHKSGVPYECTQEEAKQLLGKVVKEGKTGRWLLGLGEKPYVSKEDMKKIISTSPTPQNYWRDTNVTVISKGDGSDIVDYLDLD